MGFPNGANIPFGLSYLGRSRYLGREATSYIIY